MTDEFTTDVVGDYITVSSNTGRFEPVNIIPFTPHPTVAERAFGEIVRYFTRFVTHNNAADISEIDKATYTKLKKNPFYLTTQVRWQIRRPLDDVNGLPNINTPVRLVTGILTANKLSVQLSEEEVPGLSEYITDYKRFWQF